MNRFENNFAGGTEAKLRYLDADYQVIAGGQFVTCAISGKRIPLEELRYWSVELQEPYLTAHEAVKRKVELDGKAD